MEGEKLDAAKEAVGGLLASEVRGSCWPLLWMYLSLLQSSPSCSNARLQVIRDTDDIGIISFSSSASLLTGGGSVTDLFEMKEDLDFESVLDDIEACGMTAMWDAAERGLQALSRAKSAERILIVFTDGGDNCSSSSSLAKVVHQVNAARKGIRAVFAAVGTSGCGALEKLKGQSTRIQVLNKNTGDDYSAVTQVFEEVAELCKLVYLDLLWPEAAVDVGNTLQFSLEIKNNTTDCLPSDAKLRLVSDSYLRETHALVGGLSAGGIMKINLTADTKSEELTDIRSSVDFVLESKDMYMIWRFELSFSMFNAGIRNIGPPVDRSESRFNILVSRFYCATPSLSRLCCSS